MSDASKDHSLSPEMFARTIVLGNTASGKSWLSRQLGRKLSTVVVDLDQIRWVDGDYSRKQTVQTAIAMTIEKAAQDRWIIEGVYGWLATPILDRATCLIWIDLAWAESRQNLLARETELGPAGNFEELESWSGAYWTRQSASSYAAHLAVFERFGLSKFRLFNMAETSNFPHRIGGSD